MARDLERPAPDRKPSKLSGSEPEARVAMWLHHQRPTVTTFLTDLRNNVWSAQNEQWFGDAHVKQQADPEDGQPYPQGPLPRITKVITPPDHMNHPRDDCNNRKQDVGEMPYLVADP